MIILDADDDPTGYCAVVADYRPGVSITADAVPSDVDEVMRRLRIHTQNLIAEHYRWTVQDPNQSIITRDI